MDAKEEEWEGPWWNYRILRFKDGSGFTICEAHFDTPDGPVTMHSMGMVPVGETVEDLKANYEMMAEAFDQTPIDEK